jgi:hypothetical protein
VLEFPERFPDRSPADVQLLCDFHFLDVLAVLQPP